MLFLSPRNSLEDHLHVIGRSECDIILHASTSSMSEIVTERKSTRQFEAPEMHELLDDAQAPLFQYTKTFEQARYDPMCVVHTSGTTGRPKPVTWTMGFFSTLDAQRLLPPVDGSVPPWEFWQRATRIYMAFPLFHAAGLNAGILFAFYLGVTVVLGSTRMVPNAFHADQMHQLGTIEATLAAPYLFEELAQKEQYLEHLKALKFIWWGGGKSTTFRRIYKY